MDPLTYLMSNDSETILGGTDTTLLGNKVMETKMVPPPSKRQRSIPMNTNQVINEGEVQRRKSRTMKELTANVWQKYDFPYSQFVPMGNHTTAYATSYKARRGFGEANDRLSSKRVVNSIYARKLLSVYGKRLAYDEVLSNGSAYYLHYLPYHIMMELLQELKSDKMEDFLKNNASTLSTCLSTEYCFFHWDKDGKHVGERDEGDWCSCSFIQERPKLCLAVTSLALYIMENLYGKSNTKTDNIFPGVLRNTNLHVSSVHQAPHFDFPNFKTLCLDEEKLPLIVHVPLCKEGMLLQIWPTTFLPSGKTVKLEKPFFQYIAFGDALVLRADVAHAGCYGSAGNTRMHMVIKDESCSLKSNKLMFLHNVAGSQLFDKYTKELANETWRPDLVEKAAQSSKHMVNAYIGYLKNLYPCHNSWVELLVEKLLTGKVTTEK